MTFVVGFAPTNTQVVILETNALLTVLDRVLKKGPENEQLSMLMDTNARTRRWRSGRLGGEGCKVLGAYGRDTLNDNDKRLLSFSAIHGLVF